MTAIPFAGLTDEYAALWRAMRVNAHKLPDIEATANKIVAKKSRYQEVEAETSVPWFLVGTIHAMEAGCRFDCHLHNGDSLKARTRQVPAGRPATGKPPFPWDVSAADALEMKGLGEITDWTIERLCYELERYNGWGYRRYHPECLSPYLWSGTSHYTRGKYIADGKWSSTAISGQSGAIPIIKEVCALDGIVLRSMFDANPPETITEHPPEEPAPVRDLPSAGGWEDTQVIPDTHGEEMVNAPSQRAPAPKSAEPAPVARAAPPPQETADEPAGEGFLASRKFAQLNSLVDQGSRTARCIKHVKDATWGTVFGTAGVGGALGGKTGTVIIIGALVCGLAVLIYLIAKLAEKYFVDAANDGRYQTRKA